MKLVIDISKEKYEWIKEHKGVTDFKTTEILYNCVRKGTPLPKGHGRLIDEKEINTVVNGVFNYFDKYSPETFLNVIHDQCIEAVGADKTESEDEDE